MCSSHALTSSHSAHMAEPRSQQGRVEGKAASWIGVSSPEPRMRCGEARACGTSTAVTRIRLISGLRRPLSPLNFPGLGTTAAAGRPCGFQGLVQLPKTPRPSLSGAWTFRCQNEGHPGPQRQTGLSKAAWSHELSSPDSRGPTHGTGRKKEEPYPQASRLDQSLSLPVELSPPFLVELKHSAAVF